MLEGMFILPKTQTAEQYKSHHSKPRFHTTFSKISSRRIRDLELSKFKRRELAKHHSAGEHIARNRLESEQQMQLREL